MSVHGLFHHPNPSAPANIFEHQTFGNQNTTAPSISSVRSTHRRGIKIMRKYNPFKGIRWRALGKSDKSREPGKSGSHNDGDSLVLHISRDAISVLLPAEQRSIVDPDLIQGLRELGLQPLAGDILSGQRTPKQATSIPVLNNLEELESFLASTDSLVALELFQPGSADGELSTLELVTIEHELREHVKLARLSVGSIDDYAHLSQRYKTSSTPNFLIFRGTEVIDSVSGHDAGAIGLALKKHAATTSARHAESFPPAQHHESDNTLNAKIVQAGENGIRDSYMVTLTESCEKQNHMVWVKDLQNRYPELCRVKRQYKLLKGYSAILSGHVLQEVANSADVELIYQNSLDKMNRTGDEVINGTKTTEQTQRQHSFGRAPWGLQRISDHRSMSGSDPEMLAYIYNRPAADQLYPVDVYVIDSGINVKHYDLTGRAEWGYVVSGTKHDFVGHGTHIAATIAGNRFGVAKNATVIAIKDSDDDDRGSPEWAIECFEEILELITGRKNRSVVHYTNIPQGQFQPLEQAIQGFVAEAKVAVCVPAGNKEDDAINYSPARLSEVVTVGATDINDCRWSDSNYGAAVDIFAPGDTVISAWHLGHCSRVTSTGTCMASAHVTGVMADILSREQNNLEPQELLQRVKALSTRDVLHDIPEGSPNLLLHNGASLTMSRSNGPIAENKTQHSDIHTLTDQLGSFEIGVLQASKDYMTNVPEI